MDILKDINTHCLDKYLITFNNEVSALSSNCIKSYASVNDKFYSSINQNDDNIAVIAKSLIKQNNDYVFDKQYVNPFFMKQNTTATLLDTISNEDVIQNRLHEECEEDAFLNVKRKMNMFVSAQKSQREHEKDKKLKAAIMEYRWLYLPKLISPYIKNFMQQCLITENIVRVFTESVLENGECIEYDNYDNSDCIFGFTLKDCLDDKHAQQHFNRLFLPGIYELPKRLNTVYAFNKFIEQFYPSNGEIHNGTDTILSLFYNTVKFQNLNKSQTVASYVKQCQLTLESIKHQSENEIEDIINRLNKIQIFTVLFLILRKRYPSLKIKRAERGDISSITGEYILKADTLYLYERTNLWCVYISQKKKPFYSRSIIALFYHMIAIS